MLGGKPSLVIDRRAPAADLLLVSHLSILRAQHQSRYSLFRHATRDSASLHGALSSIGLGMQ